MGDNNDDVLSSLLEHYKLTEDEMNKAVSDVHIEVISQSHCEHWRKLPSQLKMKTIIVKDIDREQLDQEEKRLAFFKRWKQEKGFEATYKALVIALLEKKCREDAENICKLLKKSLTQSPQESTSTEVPETKSSKTPSSDTAGIIM